MAKESLEEMKLNRLLHSCSGKQDENRVIVKMAKLIWNDFRSLKSKSAIWVFLSSKLPIELYGFV